MSSSQFGIQPIIGDIALTVYTHQKLASPGCKLYDTNVEVTLKGEEYAIRISGNSYTQIYANGTNAFANNIVDNSLIAERIRALSAIKLNFASKVNQAIAKLNDQDRCPVLETKEKKLYQFIFPNVTHPL